MKRVAVLVPLLFVAAPAWAQDPVPSYAGYDGCLAEAAVRVSQSDVASAEVFGLAKRRCAGLRHTLAKNPRIAAVLDAADATKASYFPEWVNRLRERRQLQPVSLQLPADVASR